MKEQEMKKKICELSASSDPKKVTIAKAVFEVYESYFNFGGQKDNLSNETKVVILWNAMSDILDTIEDRL